MSAFQPFRFYWRVAIKPHLAPTVTVCLLMLLGALLDAGAIGLVVPLMDILTNQAAATQGPVVRGVTAALTGAGIAPGPGVVIFALLLVVSAFFILRSALTLASQYATAAIAVKLRRTTKIALTERWLHVRYDEASQYARGAIVHHLNNPPEALTAAITQLGYFVTGLCNSLLMVGLLLYLSWWATALLAVFAVAGVQGWRWIADRRAAVHGRTLYELRAELQKLQVDAIDGLKMVKAHGIERSLVERQDALLAGELRPELQLVLFRNGPAVVNEVLAVGIVLGFGAVTFLFPSLGLRVSMLVAFLLAIRRIAPAMANMNTATVNLSRYTRDLEMIEQTLTALPQERRGGQAVGRVEEVRLAGVGFAYAARPQHRVLEDVTATMRRGTVTAIVGPTGSGKSTLANLLIGLYEPQAGAVRVNGSDLPLLALPAWRRRIGYVSQDIFIFNATIRENITLWDTGLAPAQVEEAARIAQLQAFIRTLPEGYETVVGDRGVRLSGGQSQRLAIARAILKRPDVLIFDEATSALDNLTERAVYEAISALRREAVVIVIAHRLSTVRDADQIIVVQAGRVAEVGTHEALIGRRGLYAQLYDEEDATPAGAQGVAEVGVPS